MTDCNRPHRLGLVTAYAEAYRQASARSPAATQPVSLPVTSPHHTGQPPPQGGTRPIAASHAWAKPGTRPGRG